MDVGFVWDETKYKAVVSQHNVMFYEVVAAFDDSNGYEIEAQSDHEQRWLWVGKTPWDRLLVVVFTEQDLPLYRIGTAYDAEGSWKDEYHGK